jgi:hypothetical protein
MKNSDTLIKNLKSQNTKPIPKWRFTVKDRFISIIFLLSIILGGLAFSVILFAIQQLDFNLITHMSHSKIEFLLGALPFIWIVFLIVFLMLAMIGIKNSKKGYKFSFGKLFSINTAFSILMGTLFFIGGGAQWLENKFAVNVEFYESIKEKKEKMWTMPEDGYLSGTIAKITNKTLYINDFKGNNWEIEFGQANIPDVVLLEVGEKIKIMGKQISSSKFHADDIRPWGGTGKFRRDKK